MGRARVAAVLAVCTVVAGTSGFEVVRRAGRAPAPVATPSVAVPQPSTPRPTGSPVVVVTYRVEVRVPDGGDFPTMLAATMADPRGWTRAGFAVREHPDAPYLVVLVEGDEAQELCRPYDVGAEFSCQNGPLVVINAKRWRAGVPHWPSGLAAYRTMLLNHEMGHLLGQRHRTCPAPGRPAPVMQQQSGGLGGCVANPWPLPSEIERAARHDLKLAPAFGE